MATNKCEPIRLPAVFILFENLYNTPPCSGIAMLDFRFEGFASSFTVYPTKAVDLQNYIQYSTKTTV